MRKLFLIIALASIAYGFSTPPAGYVIDGRIDGLEAKTVYLLRDYDQILDSAAVVDGKFTFTGTVEEPCIVELIDDDNTDNYFGLIMLGRFRGEWPEDKVLETLDKFSWEMQYTSLGQEIRQTPNGSHVIEVTN